jgi:alginate O-acetyltransferase complex protein AlgJ
MKVSRGKKDWLFLENDTNNIVEQITGKLTFSDEKLFQWRLLLEMRSYWFSQRNISYFFLVSPNKECVYPEYLPDSIHLSPDRCINQLINYLSQHSFFKLIYPCSELIEAKQEMLVYYLKDTHWNSFGGYIAYYALLSEISKSHHLPIIPRSDMTFEQIFDPTALGDLGLPLNMPGDFGINATLLERQAECVLNNHITNTANLMIFENKNKALPRAVMFRDSFAEPLLELLAESFSRLLVIWQPNIDYTIVQDEKPDIVISQQVERFMIKVPDDLAGLRHKEWVAAKA